MNERKWERYGAASGFAMVVLGIAAMVFERAPVTATDFAANRTALLTQSMLFLARAAFSLWFVGSLRAYLLRFEGGTGRWPRSPMARASLGPRSTWWPKRSRLEQQVIPRVRHRPL